MRMRFGVGAAVVGLVVALAASVGGAGGAAAAAEFDHLQPGKVARYAERVPVQVVFVGFDRQQVPEQAFRNALPATSAPTVRSRLWYGLRQDVGLRYSFDYRLSYAPGAYQDALFGKLASLSRTQRSVDGRPRTDFQQAYNAMANNVRDVTTNYYIDAPTVERYLVEHPAPGVDPRRNTVYFINWYGRSDFRFHVYTKTGEPDPDTGYDFGRERDSRKVVAWGGTPPTDEETGFGKASRTWFYDLSAGPDSWTGSYDVDHPDLDGDGVADYRIPPIWEYLTPGGYRPASRLAGDLGAVTRYVGVNLLFASSPLYPPMLTPPDLPRSVNLDQNIYDNLPDLDPADYLRLDYLRHEEQEVLPFPVTADTQRLAFDAKARECLQQYIYVVGPQPRSCYPRLPYTNDANLFLNNAFKKTLWRDGGGDYEAGGFNYAVRNERNVPFLGVAIDNSRDGTQTGIINMLSKGVLAAGYGLTTTNIHEYGHHFSLAHPHDGYDSTSGVDYEPTGRMYFAWVGDESNSMMSYIDVNWDFSQFDKDNINRFYTAGYTTVAQDVAQRLLRSPRAAEARDELRRADAALGRAHTAVADHDYPAAVSAAKVAYQAVRAGATEAGVPVPETDPWQLDRPGAAATAATATRIAGYANDADDAAEMRKRLQP